MISISRALARRLRNVFRKSVPIGTMRGQRSPISLLSTNDGLVVRSHHSEVLVEYHQPGTCSPGELLLPGEALDDLEGKGNDLVTLEAVGADVVRARWNDGAVPQMRDYPLPDKDRLPPLPEQPHKFTTVEPGLLRALDEASHCVAREGARFSISKIQMRGRKGEVIATDGKQLLLQKGFSFPWEDDLLVPTLGVFGNKDLGQEKQLLLGRTDTHLCIRVGAWTFYLALDTTGRFPNAESVIPSLKGNTTTCTLSPDDAAFLMEALPRLPGKGGDHEPVTLDLNGHVAVRAKEDGQEKATELVLKHSTVSGPPMCIVFNRLFLGRAVGLGFRELHLAKAGTPIVCRAEGKIYLLMPLDPAAAIPRSENDLRITSSGNIDRPPSSPTNSPVRQIKTHHESRPIPMAKPEEPANGNGQHANGHTESGPSLDDLILEAETLRTDLIEMCGRVAQLSTNLKRFRKRGRAVEAALSALRLKLPALP